MRDTSDEAARTLALYCCRCALVVTHAYDCKTTIMSMRGLRFRVLCVFVRL